jgi:hypothetical protein
LRLWRWITDLASLSANLAANCVPDEATAMDVDRFHEFLARHRQLMAEKGRAYYEGLCSQRRTAIGTIDSSG